MPGVFDSAPEIFEEIAREEGGGLAEKRCLGEGAVRERRAPFLLCVLRN